MTTKLTYILEYSIFQKHSAFQISVCAPLQIGAYLGSTPSAQRCSQVRTNTPDTFFAVHDRQL